jgi:excisionase family DNA binding protein
LEVKVNKKFVTVSEMAALAGLHPNTIRNLADRGVIPTFRTKGNQRRFDAAEVLSRLKTSKTNRVAQRGQWTFALDGLEEHIVWQSVREALSLDLNLPVNKIIPYVFLEMLNNAIDHSQGKSVEVRAEITDDTWKFSIQDDGIGVFRKIREFKLLDADIEAIGELTKGKQTTDPSRHTGEGIFFSSKHADAFSLSSNGLQWHVDSLLGDQAVGESEVAIGTLVEFSVAVSTDKNAEELFRTFTADGRFVITNPRIKLFELGTEFLSRSEAKRLLSGLEKFEKIELDFKGVEKVGQAFVDEVFRVWQSEHPQIEIAWPNANAAVKFMIERGLPKNFSQAKTPPAQASGVFVKLKGAHPG